MNVKSSLQPYKTDFELPITGSGKFINKKSGNAINLRCEISHYAFVPTFHLTCPETGMTISVSNLDDIPSAELSLCLLINNEDLK